MAQPYPSKLIFGRYYTRKDFHHKSKGWFMSFYSKKWARKKAKMKLRKYRGDVSDGGWYKKVFDVPWTAVL